MGLVFFLTVTPTALIMRALGKDPLRRRLDKEATTYWIDRAPTRTGPRIHATPILKVAMSFLKELWMFMRVRKKFWLLPILIMMVVFGGLVVLTQGSAVAPFIYTIF